MRAIKLWKLFHWCPIHVHPKPFAVCEQKVKEIAETQLVAYSKTYRSWQLFPISYFSSQFEYIVRVLRELSFSCSVEEKVFEQDGILL